MPGSGPPPKPAEQRRRRNAPERGEWITLPEVTKPVVPAKLPARGRGFGSWHPRTARAWKAWRLDPATTQYGPAEIDALIELAFLHHDMCIGNEKASEIRLRMDGLGLTAKGKRDLRWRAPTETAAANEPAAAPDSHEGGKVINMPRRRAV